MKRSHLMLSRTRNSTFRVVSRNAIMECYSCAKTVETPINTMANTSGVDGNRALIKMITRNLTKVGWTIDTVNPRKCLCPDCTPAPATETPTGGEPMLDTQTSDQPHPAASDGEGQPVRTVDVRLTVTPTTLYLYTNEIEGGQRYSGHLDLDDPDEYLMLVRDKRGRRLSVGDHNNYIGLPHPSKFLTISGEVEPYSRAYTTALVYPNGDIVVKKPTHFDPYVYREKRLKKSSGASEGAPPPDVAMAGSAPVPTPSPRPLDTAQRAKVRDLLDTWFDFSTGRYSGGYSDQRIGAEIDVPWASVAALREAAYGPLKEDPRVPVLREKLLETGNRIAELSRSMDAIQIKIDEERKLVEEITEQLRAIG